MNVEKGQTTAERCQRATYGRTCVRKWGNFLAAQPLRLQAFTGGGEVRSLVRELRSPQAAQFGQKKERNQMNADLQDTSCNVNIILKTLFQTSWKSCTLKILLYEMFNPIRKLILLCSSQLGVEQNGFSQLVFTQ